jgi:hypothetical protein
VALRRSVTCDTTAPSTLRIDAWILNLQCGFCHFFQCICIRRDGACNVVSAKPEKVGSSRDRSRVSCGKGCKERTRLALQVQCTMNQACSLAQVVIQLQGSRAISACGALQQEDGWENIPEAHLIGCQRLHTLWNNDSPPCVQSILKMRPPFSSMVKKVSFPLTMCGNSVPLG